MTYRAFLSPLFFAVLLAGCQSPAPDAQSLAQLQTYISRADVRAAMIAANTAPDRCDVDNARWLTEYAAPPKDGVIAEMLARPLSQMLAKEAAQAGGQLDLVMIMDKRGCLIAANQKTHDLIQSDETKYKETIAVGAHKPLYEGTEPHPKGGIDQLSQALYDAKGAPIGIVTLRWCPRKGGCG